MEIPDTLLRPIAGPNPSGQSLRYDPVYEKVKEARREEAGDLPWGTWSRAVKTADPALVIRLTTEALSTKSKDLQLAAWLTEALLRQEGIGGLKTGLDLATQLIGQFWDTIYPLAEDGDIELRAAPLSWIGACLGEQVKRTPLTQGGYSWFKYSESRAVPSEQACEGSDAKQAARKAASDDHKLMPEVFDEDMNATPAAFYRQFEEDVDGALSSLQQLDGLCNDKFGKDSPSFGKLQDALEEVRSLASSFLDGKASAEPAPESYQEEQAASSETAEEPIARKASSRAPAPSGKPADREDAIRWIVEASRFLREAEPRNPASYMILRGLRWGELRENGVSGLTELEAPRSEIRRGLKQQAADGQWGELIEATEQAMAMPCGRAWLDVQRYCVRACRELGSDYGSVAAAVCAGVKGLVEDIPEIVHASFSDDTPVANVETLEWLREITEKTQKADEKLERASAIPPPAAPGTSDLAPDVEVLAMKAARAGHLQEAIEMLSKEIAQVHSGRARFERKMQLANLCLSTGHESIAYPILKDLANEIEVRNLDQWESPTMLAHALSLLYRCLQKTGSEPGEREAVYQRICRLDPVQALVTLKR
jgi:type VI secretion system protein ImpA